MNPPGNIPLESTACPLCAASDSEATRFVFPPYRVARCRECGLYFLGTRLTAAGIEELYKQRDYFEGEGYDSYAAQEPALRKTFRRFLRQLDERFHLSGTLLEIGCGYGFLLDEARPYFQRRVGTEFSAQAVAHSAERGDMIYQGGIDQLPREERYDCIILTQVIEHIYRPVQFLQSVREKLTPGGIVAVATPDIGSFWFPLMGRKWASFKIPEHVAFYDRRTLKKLLQAAGFKEIMVVPYPHAFPLALIAGKLAIKLPAEISRWSCWLPGTTIAMAAHR